MRKDLDQIYNDLYLNYERKCSCNDFDYGQKINAIKESIRNADNGNMLRSDARYFLLLNFDHMILKPLYESKKCNMACRLDEIEKDIDSDIHSIISKTKSETKHEKISGHQIMRTIDKLWMTFKTTELDIWG